MRLLDLGGGFSAGDISAGGDVDLGGVPAAVNGALESHFPESCGVRIIAEPGRCAAENSRIAAPNFEWASRTCTVSISANCRIA